MFALDCYFFLLKAFALMHYAQGMGLESALVIILQFLSEKNLSLSFSYKKKKSNKALIKRAYKLSFLNSCLNSYLALNVIIVRIHKLEAIHFAPLKISESGGVFG